MSPNLPKKQIKNKINNYKDFSFTITPNKPTIPNRIN